MTAPPSDADLAKQALAGSQDAYQALVLRYAGPAVNLAARMVRDRALAEDLAQEAFARAFDRLASYNPECRFAGWFFQVVHNVTVDYLRRKRVPSVSLDALQEAGHPGFADPARLAAPDAAAEQAALTRALDAALTHLRPEYREVVILRYREELSVEEIGEAMSIPVGTVKTYLFRARKEMAGLMTTSGWGRSSAETASEHRP
ncbi:MAG: sigma-70 family RNA polymerase sigma factor [Vicinamibacterales bacterium]